MGFLILSALGFSPTHLPGVQKKLHCQEKYRKKYFSFQQPTVTCARTHQGGNEPPTHTPDVTDKHVHYLFLLRLNLRENKLMKRSGESHAGACMLSATQRSGKQTWTWTDRWRGGGGKTLRNILDMTAIMRERNRKTISTKRRPKL